MPKFGTTKKTALVYVRTEIIMYHLSISSKENLMVGLKGIEPKANLQFPTSKGDI